MRWIILKNLKKNGLLNNDVIKDHIAKKSKELFRKGKVVSIDSLPDSDEKDIIKKRLK